MKWIRHGLPIMFAMMMSSGNASAGAKGACGNSATAFAAAAAAPSPETAGDDRPPQNTNEVNIPQLPEADPDANLPRLKLGETMKFEEMGPVILNVDGTTRRIDNWDEMTEQERQVTWRRISKRNEERRRKLLEQVQQEEEERGEQEDDL